MGLLTMETDHLPERAVLWPATGRFNIDGTEYVGDPVEICCRWEKATRQGISNDAEPIAISSSVYVDRDIPIGSHIWQGCLRDLPDPPTGLHKVIDKDDIPDLKAQNRQRTIQLMRL